MSGVEAWAFAFARDSDSLRHVITALLASFHVITVMSKASSTDASHAGEICKHSMLSTYAALHTSS